MRAFGSKLRDCCRFLPLKFTSLCSLFFHGLDQFVASEKKLQTAGSVLTDEFDCSGFPVFLFHKSPCILASALKTAAHFMQGMFCSFLFSFFFFYLSEFYCETNTDAVK